MDGFDFTTFEDEDELKQTELLVLQEEDMLARGRAVAEEMAAMGLKIDPLTFLLTDFHDLCQHLRLSEEQVAWLSQELASRGAFARVLKELGHQAPGL